MPICMLETPPSQPRALPSTSPANSRKSPQPHVTNRANPTSPLISGSRNDAPSRACSRLSERSPDAPQGPTIGATESDGRAADCSMPPPTFENACSMRHLTGVNAIARPISGRMASLARATRPSTSAVMVPTAAASASVAPVGPLRATAKVSRGSSLSSARVRTLMILRRVPGLKVSVPDAASKSEPATAVPLSVPVAHRHGLTA